MAPIYLGPLNFPFWSNFASKQLQELFFCKLKPAYILYNNRFRKTFFENRSIVVIAGSLAIFWIVFRRVVFNQRERPSFNVPQEEVVAGPALGVPQEEVGAGAACGSSSFDRKRDADMQVLLYKRSLFQHNR